jgi:metal-dependent amidase/aminoacylase/carboxypeptidase family protein
MNIVSKELFQHMVRIRRQIHKHPELGYQEENTAAIITEELKKLGIKATAGIAKTGVVGRMTQRTGPVVALRADMGCNSYTGETDLSCI